MMLFGPPDSKTSVSVYLKGSASFNIIIKAAVIRPAGNNLFFLSSLMRRASSVASVDGSIMSPIPCPSIVQSVVVQPKKRDTWR